MSFSIIIIAFILCISLVAATPSECRAKYENWFDNHKGGASYGFALQNNSETLSIYSLGNIIYSPAPFDYYTNINSFVTYTDAGSPTAGTPVFTPAEHPYLFFDARSLIIRRSGLISISSVGEMGSSVQFEVTCDGEVFTGVGQDGNTYILQFHPQAAASHPAPSSPVDSSAPVVPSSSFPLASSTTTELSVCEATVVAKQRTGALWKEGTSTHEVIDFEITNTGSSKITGLTVDLSFSAGASATSSWNMDASSSPSSYAISVSDMYPQSVLNNYAGLVVLDGRVSVKNVYAICA